MDSAEASILTYQLNVGQGTHEGMVGKNNEDALSFRTWKIGDHLLHLGIVADGVGGQTAGEMASNLAVEIVQSYFEALDDVDTQSILGHMRKAIGEANQRVYERSQGEENLNGMATTAVVAAILDGKLFTSHVGDSRIYFLRAEKLYRLSKDHSWVQEAMEAGLLTEDQARVHPNRNVIRRSLGSLPDMPIDQEMQSPETQQFEQGMQLGGGDTLILCSDGLTDMIEDEDIHASLQMYYRDLPKAADDLIEKANNAGGRDNITVLLMQVPEGKAVVDEPTEVQQANKEEVTDAPSTAEEILKPRVVSVPLDRVYKERRARQRRMWTIIGLSVLIALAIALAFGMGWIGGV